MFATEITLIAIALGVDAAVVAISSGIGLPTVTWRHVFRLAWHFGFFQGAMIAVGALAGYSISGWMGAWDHWVAFGLLALVGGRMIWNAVRHDHESAAKPDPTRGFTLVLLSLATSIDALAVGVSMSLMDRPILVSALVVGVVAGAMTVGGVRLGQFVKRAMVVGQWAEAVGGLVLLGIGARILAQHGVLG